jgi:acyl-CoA thioester hydrolase
VNEGAPRARGTWRDGWFVVPYEVMFRDLDYFGNVNNAVYFTYFEWARTLLWFHLIGSDAPGDIGFIVAHADCDFKQQIEMESIEICVRVGAMRTSSLAFVYEIRKDRGRQIAATGTVVVVLFDWTTRSKTPIPDELRRRIESHASEGSDSPGGRAPAVP